MKKKLLTILIVSIVVLAFVIVGIQIGISISKDSADPVVEKNKIDNQYQSLLKDFQPLCDSLKKDKSDVLDFEEGVRAAGHLELITIRYSDLNKQFDRYADDEKLQLRAIDSYEMDIDSTLKALIENKGMYKILIKK